MLHRVINQEHYFSNLIRERKFYKKRNFSSSIFDKSDKVFTSMYESRYTYIQQLEDILEENNSDITLNIENMFNVLRMLNVTIMSYDEIKNYLMFYPELVGIISDVCKRCRTYFGYEVQLSLQLYKDPEIDDEYLIMYIRMEEYDDTVMKRIRKIREEFEDRLSSSKGWILITTDFKKVDR